MSPRENIMQSIMTSLGDLSATVERNSDSPIAVPDTGFVIVRDVAPTIEDRTLGGSGGYYMDLGIPIEIYVSGQEAETRATRMDMLASQVYSAIADYTPLGLLISNIYADMNEMETMTQEGTEALQAAMITMHVEYDAMTGIG